MKTKFDYIIELKKTIKNYAIPVIATGLIFLTQNCNNEAIIVTGLTLGGAIAYIQNTIVKKHSNEYK